MILKLKYHFDAAHRLYNKRLSKKENIKVYGQCYNLHGHRWSVEVIIKGETNKYGWIVNFKDIKKVINQFDHTYLNELSILKNIIPTAENITAILVDEISKLGDFKVRVTIYETPDASITDYKS